jgi:hypothetical protein
LALLVCGCAAPEPVEPTRVAAPVEREQPTVARPAVATNGFAPTQIEILPLTELVDSEQGARLSAYVSLLDAYGEKVKAPGTFRFELYEYVQRSSEPKGQRLAIWPDIDLNNPADNQEHWRDFLRAYEFSFASQVSSGETYVLEVTCLCPNGKRLSTKWGLRPEK